MSNELNFLDPLREAGFAAGFVPRVEGVAGSYDKEEGLLALKPFHQQAVVEMGYDWSQLWRAEQVHGRGIACVEEKSGSADVLPEVDGLISNLSSALAGDLCRGLRAHLVGGSTDESGGPAAFRPKRNRSGDSLQGGGCDG